MSESSGAARLEYQPALDGLRGASVVAVLLFHSDLRWARGGYLGVSTFFTLSGFLICSLLLAERESTGAVDLRAFWARRFRRLMPAALGGLAVAVGYGWAAADSSQLADLRGDVLAALGYVANWRFVLADQSYGDLFATPSPVLHFWSLAIEEQFYVVFPLVFVLVARRAAGRPHRALATVLGGLAAASLAASVAFAGDGAHDRSYFGTDARAVELLVGALLAIWWSSRDDESRRRLGRTAALVAPGALVVLVACWSSVEQSTELLYRGGLTAYAVGSAIVVLGAIAPGGPVRAVLSVEPLRALGRYSYGIYVYHWPMFQLLSPERTELEGAALLAVRLLATAALTIPSYHLLEQPIRRRRALSGPQARLAATAAVAVVALGATAVTAGETGTTFESAQDAYADRPTTPVGDRPLPLDDELRPTIAFYGDSTALMLGLGFADWQRRTGVFAEEGGGSTSLGCGFLGATPHHYRGTVLDSRDECDAVLDAWSGSLDLVTPDICAVSSGPWNVDDRQLGDDTWRAPGDPVYDQLLREQIDGAIRTTAEHGCTSAWILMPYSIAGTVDGVRPSQDWPENEPARVDRLNEIIREVVAEHPDDAVVIDLPAWMDTTDGGQLDARLRPDLVHFDWEGGTSAEVAERFLGPAIWSAWRGLHDDETAPPLDISVFDDPDTPFAPDPFALEG